MLLQVAAKVSVDLTTDNEGRLSEQQKQEYKACMKHEYAVYKELLAENHCAHGIPAVYGTGEFGMAVCSQRVVCSWNRALHLS